MKILKDLFKKKHATSCQREDYNTGKIPKVLFIASAMLVLLAVVAAASAGLFLFLGWMVEALWNKSSFFAKDVYEDSIVDF